MSKNPVTLAIAIALATASIGLPAESLLPPRNPRKP